MYFLIEINPYLHFLFILILKQKSVLSRSKQIATYVKEIKFIDSELSAKSNKPDIMYLNFIFTGIEDKNLMIKVSQLELVRVQGH